jgi:hypothetical protein
MKKVKETLKQNGADDSVVTDFEKGAQAYAKKISTLANQWILMECEFLQTFPSIAMPS